MSLELLSPGTEHQPAQGAHGRQKCLPGEAKLSASGETGKMTSLNLQVSLALTEEGVGQAEGHGRT